MIKISEETKAVLRESVCAMIRERGVHEASRALGVSRVSLAGLAAGAEVRAGTLRTALSALALS